MLHLGMMYNNTSKIQIFKNLIKYERAKPIKDRYSFCLKIILLTCLITKVCTTNIYNYIVNLILTLYYISLLVSHLLLC